MDAPIEDWASYASYGQVQLINELARTHQRLAALHTEIAYLRAEEARSNPQAKAPRILNEGERDALIEKKFLLVRLLDMQRDTQAR